MNLPMGKRELTMAPKVPGMTKAETPMNIKANNTINVLFNAISNSNSFCQFVPLE